jgi:fused signal recognition particle receptor
MRFFRRRPEEAPEPEQTELEPTEPTEPREPTEPEPRGFEPVEPEALEPEPLEPERFELEPEPAVAEPSDDAPASLDEGLRRTRGGFMSRLRGLLGGTGVEGPSWDEVEETLIGGDVGPALAMDVVEAARDARDPEGAAHAVRAELSRRLVPRDPEWRLDAGRTPDGPEDAVR